MPYHHYIAAFHLSEFTRERTRDGSLHVFDLERRLKWRTAVNRAGGETGYNTVQGFEGLDPNAIEEYLTDKIESPAAPLVRHINDTHLLPSGSLLPLLRYIALLWTNNPASRRTMNDTQEKVLHLMAQMMVARPERFARAQEECRRDGVPLLGDMSYDDLAQALSDGTFSFRMSNLSHLRGQGETVDFLTGLLGERQWSVIGTVPDSPEYVCGDHPVVLKWAEPSDAQSEAAADGDFVPPPGFAAPGSELVIPLGRRVALLGLMEGEPHTLYASRNFVYMVNSLMVATATRFVYSRGESFSLLGDGDQPVDSDTLLNSSAPDPVPAAPNEPEPPE